MQRRPPDREIADLLREGQVIPFLGAGVNLGSRPLNASWSENSNFLPRGDELSRYLADIINFPSDDEHDLTDLAKVSSYYVETSARFRLLNRLREVFRREGYQPCSVHNFLTELAKSAELAKERQPPGTGDYKPLLIVTTNYDDLTELAFQQNQCPYDLVAHPTDRKDRAASVMWWPNGAKEPVWVRPNHLYINLDTTTVIYKMHGTVDKKAGNFDSYVVTEEDYVDFLSLMTSQEAIPALFMSHFHSRQFLFLGYGLRDWNFRVMLNNLRDVLPKSRNLPGREESEMEEGKSWAIQHNPSALEEELWNARNVKIYNQDIDHFVAELKSRTQLLE